MNHDQKITKFLNGRWYSSSRRGGQIYRRIANRLWVILDARCYQDEPVYSAYTASSLHSHGDWAWVGMYDTVDAAKLALAKLYTQKGPSCSA